ncbi:hypothetical protein QR680_000607 [Steinernema hermaphroditum]|uniref:N-acetylgalactosaminide beta-1,3-galactosyltransferase n=1 Tax=Steinernema hermaphroditum TaxID=289476 RepID=A0AA39GW20_9BILA|nr:hypothetical protein QR680_000607 [Steinernema hermaphroditum]
MVRLLLYALIVSALLDGVLMRRKGRILCLIHTATPSHETRARAILETWAQKCHRFIFFTNSPMPSHVPHIVFSELATRDHSWEKIRKVFKYAYENLYEKFDWYLRADDDAYIVMENLEKFVGRYDSNKPHLFGYRWNFYVKRGFADGGAYVISREALRLFYNEMKYNHTLCPEIHRAEEDQEFAKCLSKISVYPSRSTDDYGKQLFHHFHPMELESSFLFQFIVKYSFDKFEPFPVHYSRDTISMHHLSPFEMRMYHYLLYGVKYHQRSHALAAPTPMAEGNLSQLTASVEKS